jgi:hypothetical protein
MVGKDSELLPGAFRVLREPLPYGTVCPVVQEDGGGNPVCYPTLGGTGTFGLRKRVFHHLSTMPLWRADETSEIFSKFSIFLLTFIFGNV